MAYVPDELLKCIAFLGYINQDGKEKFAGSAFWISRAETEGSESDNRLAYLVTAGHVIDYINSHTAMGSTGVRVRVNTREGAQRWVDTPLHFWKMHPDYPKVDLAVLKIGICDDWDHLSWAIEAFVSESSIENDGRRIELGDELFFAGLFWPHAGEKRNIPIVRIGNVAALRSEPVLNREGQPMDAYLVETHSIGGLSGSPVFIDVHAAKASFAGETPFFKGNYPVKYRLMGLVHGHFQASEIEPDVVVGDGRESIDINTGIAIVTPAERIMEVLELFAKEEEKERETRRSSIASDSRANGANAAIQFTSGGISGSNVREPAL